MNKDKKIVGVLMGMFLSLIGLVIGLLLYPEKTEERETFMNGWIKGFIITIVISIFAGVIIYVNNMNAVNKAIEQINYYY